MGDPWDVALKNKGLINKFLNKNRWILDKSHTLEWGDYYNIGLMTIREAAISYDQAKGRFSCYAWKRLKWGLFRAFKTQAFPIMRVPEKRHPKKGMDISAMTAQESWTYNVCTVRLDLSCTEYLPHENYEDDQESESFVFFD
jgi:DNA-directed RNA polymerase specialized sigma subunit